MKQSSEHRFDEIDNDADDNRAGWRARLRSDFRLALICIFGLVSALAILPLAIYRLASGDWVTGIGDLVFVFLFTGLGFFAWTTGRVRFASRALAIVVPAGFLGLVMIGNVNLFWAYPWLGAAFLVTDRWFATFSALSMLTLTCFMPGRFDSGVDIWSFLAAGALVTLFGLIFATRTELQRRHLAVIASHDPLTGAGNRRAMRAVLDALLVAFKRRGESVSLALLDLDHFKAVNDVHGHEAGDSVLVQLVEIAEETIRPEDRIFRVGGEEFVLVLPQTDLRGALVVAEKLRMTLAETLQGPGGPITASMGIAELRAGEEISQWLSRADEALYRAKRSGRNRVEIMDDIHAPLSDHR